VDDAAVVHLGLNPAQLLVRDVLARDLLDHLGAGDEEPSRLLDHDDEVGQGRRVGGSARAGPGHDGDLGHDARELDVAEEDPPVAGQGVDALLDPCSAAVVDEHEGSAALQGQVHHLADLVRVHLADGAAGHGEVLGGGEDLAALDGPRHADDSFSRQLLALHAEGGAAMSGIQEELLGGLGVEEQSQALARGALASGPLFGDAGLAAALAQSLSGLAQAFDSLLGAHVRLPALGWGSPNQRSGGAHRVALQKKRRSAGGPSASGASYPSPGLNRYDPGHTGRPAFGRRSVCTPKNGRRKDPDAKPSLCRFPPQRCAATA
jgi:hypothetical protein